MEKIDPAKVPQRTLYTGAKMPAVGMGTFGSDHATAEQVQEAVRGAIKVGYRHFDCAACYGNEAQIGQVFTEAFAAGEVKREDLFIVSKVWNDMHGKGDVLLACARTLKDLQLDYLDMYYVHWPFPNYHPPKCEGTERNPDSKPFSVGRFMATWRQMERLVDMGLTRHIGMSNMTLPKLKAVLPLCRIKPAAIEMELHPCFQQQELFDYVRSQGIQAVGFCPLGSPDRPERDRTAEDIADLEQPIIRKIAQAHGVHPVLVAIKWAVQRGQTPIPFSIKEKNYTSNLKCVTEDPLTEEEMEEMKKMECNNRLVKGQVFLWPGAEDWQELWDPDGTDALWDK
ncbi:aldo/keto reductase [Bilifractor porci]|uniref:Aldo/keto reductase n=1 Tax=Bilifractor porci TaxID=2606636 RepID=A0A7X2P8Y1_9FIRM|nr:aldo/keto reductase [Bilifractor porci]MST82422.1 aldo/keto reductase [Bilifractor porci]